MGIGGSGMSAVAGIAQEMGYKVDGCDINLTSPYLAQIKDKIRIKKGHSPAHVNVEDILVVSPAVYYKYPPEAELAKNKNPITWEKFLGTYLHKGKEVIAVSGTHGKSTTTALLSLVFEAAGFDPTVMVGAKVREWEKNYRVGRSNIFITEADEFYENFLNYTPEAIILTNVELDHPEYFKKLGWLTNSFKKHVRSLVGKKILVANGDDLAVRKVVGAMAKQKLGIETYTYTILPAKGKHEDFRAKILSRSPEGAKFKVFFKSTGETEEFSTKLVGDFNVSNVMAVIALSSLYSIKPAVITKVLKNFTGIGRRMELVGEKNGVFVYDDYAHHPTAIRETIKAVKQKHPISRIFAVVEPHSYSRVAKLLKGYTEAFSEAYSVIIAPIFKARDTENYGMSEEKLVGLIKNDRVNTYDSFDKIAEVLPKELKKNDVVLVMGAGKSSDLAKMIIRAL